MDDFLFFSFFILWHFRFYALLPLAWCGGKSEIYGSVATLKFNITFNGKPLTLMIETESRSGACVAFDWGFFHISQNVAVLFCAWVCVRCTPYAI